MYRFLSSILIIVHLVLVFQLSMKKKQFVRCTRYYDPWVVDRIDA